MPIKIETPATTAPNYFNPPLASDPSAQILNDHRAQSSTTIDGWAATLFGFLFMSVGAAV